ncbi:MAG: ATP-binding cassette domain-containing protein, partial [Aeromonas allosaccharophila]
MSEPLNQLPLIQLKGVERRYQSGDSEVTVLHPLDLTIAAGEMIAIVGASGSGKSTLMNLLGCLDSPSCGQYLFRGQDTATMDALALARLRCHHFGFIFQRYHLLPHLDAAANVEIPAVYAGTSRPDRQARARQLLGRLGLADRSHHTPGQLSGGQQQRVSIARALVNGGEVILADEPTGALDSQSGKEVMAILKELHVQGHTIILVTHDMNVASHADRIITLKDGRIEQDSGPRQTAVLAPTTTVTLNKSAIGHDWDRYREAGRMAMHAMLAHQMRTFLTMLGIIIGIAAVVSVVALGQGARAKVIDQINAMGTNTIEIFPGKGWGDEKMASIQTLNKGDLDALLGQPYLAGASPEIGSSGQLRYRNKTNSGSVTGVGNDYFKVKGMTLVSGRLLEWQDIQQRAAVAVVDKKS